MTDAPTISTLNVQPGPIARIMPIGMAALLSMLATTLTVLVVTFVAFFPHSLIVFQLGVLVLSLYFAVVFSAPITLVFLPLAAIFLRRGIPALIILSIVGLIGGMTSVWLWRFFLTGTMDGLPHALSLGVVIGAIGGLVAGGCFGLALVRLGK